MPFDLDEFFVRATEEVLGASLPASYRTAMCRENGGAVETEDDDWELFPIADTSDRKRTARTANHVLSETALCRRWPGFPADALAIGSNGAGDRLVLLKEGAGYGAPVYRWLHEEGVLDKLADDFSALQQA